MGSVVGWKSFRYLRWILGEFFPLTAMVIPEGEFDPDDFDKAVDTLRDNGIPSILIKDDDSIPRRVVRRMVKSSRARGLITLVETSRSLKFRGTEPDALILRWPVGEINTQCDTVYLRADIHSPGDIDDALEAVVFARKRGAIAVVHVFTSLPPETMKELRSSAIVAVHNPSRGGRRCLRKGIAMDLSGNFLAPCAIAGRRIPVDISNPRAITLPDDVPCHMCPFSPS